MSESDIIAQFLAKGGEIKKLPTGEYKPSKQLAKTGAERFAEAVVGGKVKEPKHGWRVTSVEKADPKPRITVVTDHAGREFYKNEEGEWL